MLKAAVLALAVLTCVTQSKVVTPCTGHPDQEPPPPVYYNHDGYRPLYIEGADPTLPQSYRDAALQLMQQYADEVYANAPPTWEYIYGPYVYYGGAGRALAFLRLWRYYAATGDAAAAADALAKAGDYAEHALARAAEPDREYIAFLKGQPGVLAVAAVARDASGNHDGAMQLVEQVRVAFETNVTMLSEPFFDTGIAGLLYCARFLESYFGEPMIDEADILNAATTLYQIGFHHATDDGVLQWPDDDSYAYIGQGMGASGILRELMLIPAVMQDPTMSYHIRLTVDMIVGRQEPTGQVMETQSDFIQHPYAKVQWCHGAPGQVPVFALAAQLYAENYTTYLTCSESAANFTVRKGALVKGMCLCHGTSGNIYVLLDLYAKTKNPEWLYNANTLLMFALDTPALTNWDQMLSWDCVPYSIFVDSVVAAMSLFADILTNIDAPENCSMPAWGLTW